MGRSATGKKRAKPDAEIMKAAANDVITHKRPLREVAKDYGLSKSTLGRHIKKYKLSGQTDFKYEANNATQKVFTIEQEEELLSYILKAAQWNFGVTVDEMKKLAFQYAEANNIKYPEKWKENGYAGRQWYRTFRKSYKDKISLRKPESTSLGRMASFNKPNVEIFFGKLREIYERYSLQPQNVWNLDETGCSTVHKPSRVIGDIKAKQIGAATSGERGINVTMIGCVNAAGTFIPPAIIFPRVHYKDHMINNAPPGTLGMATSSGWSNAELFVNYLKYFISMVKPSRGNEVLLVMDNHESHLSLEAINLAKESGIVFLTFPPHTSHKLQPLDRSVFGPFKGYYNKAAKDWMIGHPGKPISIYDVSALLGKAFPLAFTPNNITSRFRVAGIWPFNAEVFGDDEFLPAEMTNRPYTAAAAEIQLPDASEEWQNIIEQSEEAPSTSRLESATVAVVTPEQIRPFPRAPPRKSCGRGRKPGRCMIVTDSPEKQRIEEEKSKKGKACPKKKAVKRAVSFSSSSSDEELPELGDSSGGSRLYSSEDEDFSHFFPSNEGPLIYSEGSWVLVKFQSAGRATGDVYYTGLVVEHNKTEPDVTIKFLKKQRIHFVFPSVDDISSVNPCNIVKVLPTPIIRRGIHSFNIPFPQDLNLK